MCCSRWSVLTELGPKGPKISRQSGMTYTTRIRYGGEDTFTLPRRMPEGAGDQL